MEPEGEDEEGEEGKETKRHPEPVPLSRHSHSRHPIPIPAFPLTSPALGLGREHPLVHVVGQQPAQGVAHGAERGPEFRVQHRALVLVQLLQEAAGGIPGVRHGIPDSRHGIPGF